MIYLSKPILTSISQFITVNNFYITMEPAKKRVRSTNFSQNERELLCNIVFKYKHIVENKKTDNVTSEEKLKTWKIIAQEFNASSPSLCLRTAECLKKFYSNKKKEIRKQVADEKKEITLTGGGVPLLNSVDSSKDLMLSIMNDKTTYGLTNRFDGEAQNIAFPSGTDSNIVFEVNIDEQLDELPQGDTIHGASDIIPEQVQVAKWKKYKLVNLSMPTTSVLKRGSTNSTEFSKKSQTVNGSRRRPTTYIKSLTSSAIAEKYDILIHKRITIATLQAEKLQTELDNQNEEHKLKMDLLKTKIDLKKKQLQEYLNEENVLNSSK